MCGTSTRNSNNVKTHHADIPYYIAATKLRNYALKDQLCDYLDVYGPPTGINTTIKYTQKNATISTNVPLVQACNPPHVANMNKSNKPIKTIKTVIDQTKNSFSKFLFSRGNEFEKRIVDYFANNDLCKLLFGKKFTTHYMTPMSCSRINIAAIDANAQETMAEMAKGTHLIYQAYVVNRNNKTYGQPDLLIREDAFKTIFNSDHSFPPNTKFAHKYNYIIVDIKCSTLHLAANGINFHNNASIPAIKTQLCVYQHALNAMQNSNIMSAYILCKKCTNTKYPFTNKNKSFSDNFGTIDFAQYDAQYVDVMNKGLEWLHQLYRHGSTWEVLPNPSVVELYPNTSVMNPRWDKVKRVISNTLCDITQIWHCGIKQQRIAYQQSIKSWKDRRCTAKMLGFKPGSDRYRIVNEILRVNRGRNNMSKKKIQTNLFNWKEKNRLEFFVDFETINDITVVENMSPIIDTAVNGAHERIFMIGVAYRVPNCDTLEYKSFIANNLTLCEECRVLDAFESFMVQLAKQYDEIPNVYHWSHAEYVFLQRAQKRHQRCWHSLMNDFVWFDFLNVVRKEAIIIKGALSFSLKSIGNAMYRHGMIDINWAVSDCCNGLDAMVMAMDAYNSSNFKLNKHCTPPHQVLSIVPYNEIDCKMVDAVVQYLRNHCCS